MTWQAAAQTYGRGGIPIRKIGGTLELGDKDLPVGLDLDGWASGLPSVVVAGGNGGEGGAGGRGGDGGRGIGDDGGDAQGRAFSRAVEIEGNRGVVRFGDVVAGDGDGAGGRARRRGRRRRPRLQRRGFERQPNRPDRRPGQQHRRGNQTASANGGAGGNG